MQARPELSGVSCSFEHALWYAAWWTRMALDLAPNADLHAGVLSHLKGGLVQLDAAETLSRPL